MITDLAVEPIRKIYCYSSMYHFVFDTAMEFVQQMVPPPRAATESANDSKAVTSV